MTGKKIPPQNGFPDGRIQSVAVGSDTLFHQGRAGHSDTVTLTVNNSQGTARTVTLKIGSSANEVLNLAGLGTIVREFTISESTQVNLQASGAGVVMCGTVERTRGTQ